MSVVCPHCSHTNRDQAKICARCGNQLHPGNQDKEKPQRTFLPVLTDSVPSTSTTTPEPYSGRSGATPFTPDLVSETYGSHVRRLKPGTLLSEDRYKIDRLVAAGGMGAVYRAVDARFNRPCAVKEMLDEFQNDNERNQAVEWFGREATMLLDLSHPCIPRVRDFFVQDGKHYLVMDFIEGRTLGEVLEKEGNVAGLNGARGVSEARARSWAQQVCSVLSYLHRQAPSIIFRDLKPSNVMVTTRDDIKLIDFGIARTFQSQRQATIMMTVGYAPPEQLHGMPEPRSDLYALGATLHRVLTHHDAVNNKPSIFSFPPIRLLRPDISPAFEQVVMKALSPAIEQRWATAADMERAVINLPPVTETPPILSIAEFDREHQLDLPQTAGSAPVTPGTAPSTLVPEIDTGRNSDIESGPIVGFYGVAGSFIRTAHDTTGPAGTYISPALGHINAGRVEAAYQAVQQAYALEPNNSLVHRTFGQVFARRQPPDIDAAMRAYNRSLQLDPNDPETHKLVGDVSLFLRKQPLQAVPAYIQSLRLKPDDYEAHQRLAQCYEETNQLDLALSQYQEAARLAPQATTAQFALGQLTKRMNQFAIAERAFIQVATANPADRQVHFLLGQVYENENKLDDALRAYLEAARLAPQNPAVQFALGQLARRMNQFTIAERAFVQVLTINPADHPTRFLLSQVYESENKLDLALEQCNYVVRAMPGNQAAQAMLQRLNLRLGRGPISSELPPPLPTAEVTSSKSYPLSPAIKSTSSQDFAPYAIARVLLEEQNVAFVGEPYSVQAGIPESRSEDGKGVSMAFEVLLHTSENIKLKTEWHKRLLYDPFKTEAQLIEFTFQAIAPGHSSLVLDFYHDRRWLRTMRFEFETIEKS